MLLMFSSPLELAYLFNFLFRESKIFQSQGHYQNNTQHRKDIGKWSNSKYTEPGLSTSSAKVLLQLGFPHLFLL